MRTSILACSVLLGACLSNPATVVTSNGRPMRLKFESGTGTYVSNDVVSEDTIVDSNGNEAGAIQHRADVTHSYRWSQWGYYQGKTKLDEQDYYRLAGDTAAYGEVKSKRDKAERYQKLGIPIAVVGYVAEALLVSYGSQHNDSTMENLGIYGGTAVGALGTLMYTYGVLTLRNPHLLAQDRAEDNADILETCREGQRCRLDRGGRRAHKLEESELRQLRVPFQRTSLGMR